MRTVELLKTNNNNDRTFIMTTELLLPDQHSLEDREVSVNDAMANYLEQRRELRERFASDPEFKQAMTSAATVRKANGDPNFANVAIEDLVAYSDFEGAHAAMRQICDFRTKEDGSYGERWEAVERAEKYLMADLPVDTEEQMLTSLEQFKLVGDTMPENPEAKAAIILGGGGKSPLERTEDIKARIDRGEVKVPRLVGLGSERKVDDAERQRAGEYATNAETEFDLVVAAFEHAFQVKIEPEDITTITTNSDYDVPRVHKLVAIPENFRGEHPELIITSSGILTNPFIDVMRNGKPAQILRNRANTDDTFKLLTHLKLFEPGDRLFVSTQAHFAPFQGQSAANEFAKQGIYTEVLGFQPKVPKKLYELLQETLSLADKLSSDE